MTATTPWYVDTYTTDGGEVINNLRDAEHRIIATCPDRDTAMAMVARAEHGPLWDDVQSLRQRLADAVVHHDLVQAEQRAHYMSQLDTALTALRQMRERYEPC
jgi:acetyl esterase/lipase